MSKLKLDISGDFEGVCNDFFETATYKVDGSPDVVLRDCVLTEPHTIRELEPTGAQVLRHGTLFVWSKSRSRQPVLGAHIVDPDGTYWTIYQLVNKQHVETWECFGLNLSIITASLNQATVLKAVYTHGRAGEAKAHWKGLWSGVDGGTEDDVVPAHFQPAEETSRIEFGADWSEQAYRVYFKQPFPREAAGGEFRILDSEGHRFRVVRYFMENRIDKLPVALSVRITEGAEYWANPGSGP